MSPEVRQKVRRSLTDGWTVRTVSSHLLLIATLSLAIRNCGKESIGDIAQLVTFGRDVKENLKTTKEIKELVEEARANANAAAIATIRISARQDSLLSVFHQQVNESTIIDLRQDAQINDLDVRVTKIEKGIH